MNVNAVLHEFVLDMQKDSLHVWNIHCGVSHCKRWV